VVDDIRFDWNEANIAHLACHGVKPEEAEQVILNGPVDIDYQVVSDEDRVVVVGRTNIGRFLTLVFTLRRKAVRVITGWDAEPEEEAAYWSATGA
jgi:hypothetical protein